MFLGTGKMWWLATLVLVVSGLIVTSIHVWLGLLILLIGMVVFSTAPRKKGPPPEMNLGNLRIVQQVKGAVNSASTSAAGPATPATGNPASKPRPAPGTPPKPVAPPEIKPRSKIEIDARDATDV